MTVLRRIQIKNFRSIKSLDIDTNYLTLLVGQNDAGKSNILRALNLFFNGETNPNAPFFFEEDNYALNNPNRKAPRIEISIEIELPQNYQRTNGERVVWTKKWRHFGLESSEYYGVRITQNRLGNEVREKVNIPDKSNAHALLRQINFIYVPAIKDTLYFERLRGAIYQLISDVGAQTFKESSSNFEGSIAEHLVDLTSSISAKLGFETNLALPKDLTHIFERLDFLGGDHTISLNNRGDGIKARHIPIILKFLAEQKKNTQTRGGQPYTFIWGYEEPENNVEMSRCFEMADEFWDYMNNDVAQVLITTHSPVFYSLTDKNEDGAEWATRHHIFLNSVKEGTQTTSDPADLDDRMGITRLMAPYIKIERQKFEARTRAKYEAERLAEDNRLPIYVEGPSDNTVITKAIEVFAPHILDRVSVQNAEESGGTEYVKNMLIAWDRKMKHETNRRRAYGLFDDDKAGQDDKKETELHIQTNGQKRVSFSSKLNVPVALRSLRNRFQMPIPITLEAYYPIEVWNAANERGWLESRDVRKIITPNQMNNCIDGQSLEEQLGEHYHPIIKSEFMLSRKNSAAQYVTRMDNIETVLADFQPIIRKISETLFHEEEHPWQQEAAEQVLMTDQSNNNGGNNINISGTNINIDGGISQQQNNQFDDFGRLQINAYRSRITPLKVSSGQLLSVGVVTFALAMLDTFGSLASLLSLSQGQTTPYLDRIFGNASLFIIMLSGLCLIFGIWLHFRSGSMGLPYFLGNLERAKSRKLFLTDVKAKCPMCPTGIMSMYPASKRNQDHTLVCNNSPDHRLVFDMTTLPDVEEEYNVRKA